MKSISGAHGKGASALVLASATGFATMPIMAKLAYSAGASLATVLAYRFLVAGALLWIVVRRLRIGRGDSAPVVASLVLGTIFVIVSLTMFLALERIPAGLASLLFYTYPALVTIGSVIFLRERLSPIRFVLMALSAAGCVLIFAPNMGFDGDGVLIGAALALCSALSYTIYILIGYRVGNTIEPLHLAAGVVAVNAIVFGVNAAVGGELVVSMPADAWAPIMGIAVLSSAIAIGAFLTGMRIIGPSKAALLSSVEPALTVMLALFVLDERLQAVQYVGGALILAAVVGLRLEPRRSEVVERGLPEPLASTAAPEARRAG